MRILAKTIKCHELKPGDLFSAADQVYWDLHAKDEGIIAQKLYVRTDWPTPVDQAEQEINRITIVREEGGTSEP